ncbi:hypothetical protein CPAR01_16140 [Colletotrichum paranaense]|uniref:Uncharacterized protein n=1 Tax=Colletotrichum paranaense TaxID=1914294 RepID=A0ABQ9RWR6_9PEZI|nr:uncharacterized protein CPAR01_16140 [Colletotrichum paranaense]KAK1517276.1 hypothetical protein CPAR01_16140 [Colletotrichum paranaense]
MTQVGDGCPVPTRCCMPCTKTKVRTPTRVPSATGSIFNIPPDSATAEKSEHHRSTADRSCLTGPFPFNSCSPPTSASRSLQTLDSL